MKTELYDRIKKNIDRIIALDGKESIVIYPYGNNGKEVKKFLNAEYGITEKFIVDNKLAGTHENIYALKDLNEKSTRGCFFLITSNNPDLYDDIRDSLKFYVKENQIVDMFPKVRMWNDARVESLRLMAENLNENDIKGNVAEVGVYKGDFAKEINKYFKNRVLYLFDTFEGFNHSELVSYIDQRFLADLYVTREQCANFVNNDVAGMLLQFPAPENCVIKKGFFPKTAEDIEDTFCFVSLDVDIYQGTRAGLDWFWPRMSKCGVIMIHDYNNFECPGVKKAVDEFCREKEIGLVCIPDGEGTVVLTK